MNNKIRIVLLGDAGVGKSSIIVQYFMQRFVEQFKANFEETYSKEVTIDGDVYTLEVVDTIAQDQYDFWRETNFKSGDAYFIVYSITDRASFNHIRTYRDEIIDEQSDKFMVIANKCDMISKRAVEQTDGLEAALSMGAAGFCEISSRTGINVNEAFDMMLRKVINAKCEIKEKKAQSIKRKISEVSPVLPWNWPKIYRWDQKLKKIRSELTTEKGHYDSSKAYFPGSEIIEEMPAIKLIPSDVFQDFVKHFNDEDGFHDVTFYGSQNLPIFCHRIIIALRSPHFKRMFSQEKLPMTMTFVNIDQSILTLMLKFCYDPSRLETTSEPDLKTIIEINETFEIEGLSEFASTLLQPSQSESQPTRNLLNSALIQKQMSPGLSCFDDLCDVKFSVNDQIFSLHRPILISRSKYFEAMLCHHFKEQESPVITIQSMSVEVFKKVIEYLYTGRIEYVPAEIVIELLTASDLIGLPRLLQICEKSIPPLLEVDNVVAVCQAAEHHEADQLIEVCIHFMTKEYDQVKNDPEFEYLSDKTKQMLSEKHKIYCEKVAAQKKLQDLTSKIPAILYRSQ